MKTEIINPEKIERALDTLFNDYTRCSRSQQLGAPTRMVDFCPDEFEIMDNSFSFLITAEHLVSALGDHGLKIVEVQAP